MDRSGYRDRPPILCPPADAMPDGVALQVVRLSTRRPTQLPTARDRRDAGQRADEAEMPGAIAISHLLGAG